MIIFPAIDIQKARVVRLMQGRFDEESVYSDDPVAVARQWQAAGAGWLHVVDLDGARLGKVTNYDTITRIAREVPLSVQTGGGIRTLDDIERYIDNGIRRVILGTSVIDHRDFLHKALSRWPDKIAVALDCSKGMVAQRGWTETTNRKAVDFARELEQQGVTCLIYTDISKDGTLQGPDIEGLKNILKAVSINVIASGGISGIGDIQNLCALKSPNLLGAITGKALYEGKLNLQEALQKCSPSA